MSNWTIINNTYLYDGTIEGLLTIAVKCFKEKEIPERIQVEADYIVTLLEKPLLIETRLEDSSWMIQCIIKKASEFTLYHVFTAFLSGDKEKENIIIRYLIYAFKYGWCINGMKDIEWVLEIQRICKNVKGEAHRLTGFLRFKQLSNNFLYAEYESDNDVLEFLAIHFKARLMKEIWMIHDIGRKKIALYNCKEFVIVDSSTIDITMLEEDREDQYLKLWKEYFKNISIKERENRRCQMHFMPKKYWKHLPEV